MKNTANCPKCESQNIYEIIGSTLNTYQKIPLNSWGTSNAILNRYICATCGYTEEYVQLSDRFHNWARKNTSKRSQSNNDLML